MKRPSMNFLAVGLAFLLVAVLSVAAQSTTQNLFVEVTGTQQNQIEGDSQFTGYEGQIEAVEYHHQMNFDPKGLLHKEVIWTKRADSASVNLWTAFREGEILDLVIFHHYGVIPPDIQGEVMTVTLTGARILAIETYEPENNPEFRPYERLRMNYQKLLVDQQGGSHEVTDPSN